QEHGNSHVVDLGSGVTPGFAPGAAPRIARATDCATARAPECRTFSMRLETGECGEPGAAVIGTRINAGRNFHGEQAGVEAGVGSARFSAEHTA
ncbi:hypothetical protein OJ587_11670, partial [Streptococcus anginosus]|nr:hypothetical protein [Streptococcus anginosus]